MHVGEPHGRHLDAGSFRRLLMGSRVNVGATRGRTPEAHVVEVSPLERLEV